MRPNDERFRIIQKEYRKKFLVLQQKLEKEYFDINSKLMDKVQRFAFDFAGPDGLFSKSDWDQIKLEIDAMNYWFTNELKDWLQRNIGTSADLAIQGQDTAAEYFIRSLMDQAAGYDRTVLKKAISDGGSGILLRANYGKGLAQTIQKAAWARRWKDGFKLSDRVWKINRIMDKSLRHMVEDCVNQGKSAVDFSRAVEDLLETPGPAWRTDIKKGLQVGDKIQIRQGVSYTIKQPRSLGQKYFSA